MHLTLLQVPDCRLSDDLGQLYESSQFADVTLACEGREFHCVKSLLVARSQVFAAIHVLPELWEEAR